VQLACCVFAADKRGFKLRHGINMPPTTSQFRGSNVKGLGLLFLSQPPVLSFQEANNNDRNEDKDGAKDPGKDDGGLAGAALVPRPNNRGCRNWPSAVWSFIGERAHAAIDGVADVVVRGAVARLGTVLPKKPLRTLELAAGPCKARSAVAPSVHLVALGAVVTKALVDAVRSKSAGGAGLGAMLAHQTARAAALASYVVAVGMVLTPALVAAALPVETGLAGAGAVWTGEARRADATS
jgi:hypothetical protein